MAFDDVVTFNCAFCDLIAHLTFQIRKVLVTRNSNQTTRRSLPRGVGRLGTKLPRYIDTDVIHMIKWTRPSFFILHTAGDQNLDGGKAGNRLALKPVCSLVNTVDFLTPSSTYTCESLYEATAQIFIT